MTRNDKKIISEREVELDNKVLPETLRDKKWVCQRVINESGVPYTCLITDGVEYMTCPTEEENNMFKQFRVTFKIHEDISKIKEFTEYVRKQERK